MDARARYDEIVDDLVAQNDGVTATTMMGMPSVKRNGKLVAGFAPGAEAMTFKLTDPAAHADALALEGAELFDPSGRGRPMKAWVQVPVRHADRWPELARRALESS